MATRQTVAPGTTITAAWGNNVMDGIVNTFASSGARTSAISPPSESMLTYLTDVHRFEGYDGSQYAPLPFSQTVVKAVDESVTSSITLQDDDALLLPVSANATYELRVTVYYSAAAGGGLKCGFTFPAGATLTAGVVGYLPGGSFTISRTSASFTSGLSNLAVEGGSQQSTADYSGTLITASTSGTIRMLWAQNISNGTATVVKAGSLLRLTRIS